MSISGVHDRRVDHHVVVQELGGSGGIGKDATDRSRDEEYTLRAVCTEPIVDGRLVPEVQLLSRRREQVFEAFRTEPAQEGRSDQASVAGHKHSRRSIHHQSQRLPSCDSMLLVQNLVQDGAIAACLETRRKSATFAQTAS